MRIRHPLGLLILIFSLGLVAVAWPAERARGPAVTTDPAPEDRPGNTYAVADDNGAVVVSTARGWNHLRAFTREGRLVWKLRTRQIPVACGPCPSVILYDRLGRLRRFSGDGSMMPLDLHGAGVTQTLGLAANRSLSAARADDGRLLLHTLPTPGRRALRVPIPDYIEGETFVAVDDVGYRATAVGPLDDPLRIGEKRVVFVEQDRVVGRFHVDVSRFSLHIPPRATACTDRHGSRVLLLLRGEGGWSLHRAVFGGRPVQVAWLETREQGDDLAGCAFLDSGRSVTFTATGGQRVVASWWNGKIRTLTRTMRLGNGSVTACQRSGRVVVTDVDTKLVTVLDTGRKSRYAASQGGCTETGHLWLLTDRGVRWLTS